VTILIWPRPSEWGAGDRHIPDMPVDWIQSVHKAAGNARVEVPRDETELAAAATEAEGWIGKLTAQQLAAAPKLRWLQVPTVSLETVMFPDLAASDVVLTRMTNINGEQVANHALTLFLALCRGFPRLVRAQIAGEWRRDIESLDPGQMTVIVVALGAIGAALAERLAVLGATVIGVDPKVSNPPRGVRELHTPDHLSALLPRADAVIVCAPQTPETIGWFDEAMFRRMRPNTIFINVGRGQVVKIAALERALAEGWIAMAGLDVFEHEPLPADSPLWKMEQVIVTPHIAGRGHGSERRLGIIVENVRRFVAGQPLLGIVDKSLWY
jgi:phosphoglycerate dehydrogenase-like enzyme